MTLPTAYLAPLPYYQTILEGRVKKIDVWEHFPKRTFRNRCLLQGGQMLSLPVGKAGTKQFTKDVRLTYQLDWPHQHWNTLVSLYGHTPYFLYYEDYIRPIYEKRYEWLIDFNEDMNSTILCLLRNYWPTEENKDLFRLPASAHWMGEIHFRWEEDESVLSQLFRLGPELLAPKR